MKNDIIFFEKIVKEKISQKRFEHTKRVLSTAFPEVKHLTPGLLILLNHSREAANEMMQMNKYIDVLIPRGGQGLINTVVENSKIPVIETGTGNCHAFIDETADIEMAVKIVENGKTQRPGVCNGFRNGSCSQKCS